MNHLQRHRLDAFIRSFFVAAAFRAATSPGQFLFFWRSLRAQTRLARRRRTQAALGLTVPPVLIASVTQACNLACAGCYHQGLRRQPAKELPAGEFARIFREARDLGTGVVLVAGGEPFARPDLFTLLDASPDLLFPVFTNGLLLDQARITALRQRPNVVPVISVDGNSRQTDTRRGPGSWRRIMEACARLKQSGLLFAHAITVDRQNLDQVTDPLFLKQLRRGGARAFVFVEYVPVQAGSSHLLLGAAGRQTLHRRVERLRRSFGDLLVVFPGDESAYGGCLAAGRGFVHINASGGLEACPFAPFGDTNLAGTSLRQALASPFLAAIRANHASLSETSGCALWANREWVQTLLPDASGGLTPAIQPRTDRAPASPAAGPGSAVLTAR